MCTCTNLQRRWVGLGLQERLFTVSSFISKFSVCQFLASLMPDSYEWHMYDIASHMNFLYLLDQRYPKTGLP